MLSMAVGVAVAAAGPVQAGLKTVGLQPYAATAKVVEVRGERGAPNPMEWVFLLQDSSARGGVREVVMVDGKITSERTPLRGMADVAGYAPLDPKALGVDAEAVFRIVHKEATQAELGFDWIDYTLRMDNDSHEPVWTVRLYDRMGAPVGLTRISAKGGAVVAALQSDSDVRARAQATSGGKEGGIIGRVSRSAERAVKGTSDTTLRFLGTLQEEFTGERTIGPKEEE